MMTHVEPGLAAHYVRYRRGAKAPIGSSQITRSAENHSATSLTAETTAGFDACLLGYLNFAPHPPDSSSTSCAQFRSQLAGARCKFGEL